MQEAKVRALFELANVRVTGIQQIPNEYFRQDDEDMQTSYPWWLVNTPAGVVKIGWRKRVISINWEGTVVRQVITEDDVTKDEICVHAWSYPKALEYLTGLKKVMDRSIIGEKSPVPKTLGIQYGEVRRIPVADRDIAEAAMLTCGVDPTGRL